jgi:hypothetical protein
MSDRLADQCRSTENRFLRMKNLPELQGNLLARLTQRLDHFTQVTSGLRPSGRMKVDASATRVQQERIAARSPRLACW